VNDVLLLGVARPRDVALTGRERRADGMHAWNEASIGAQHVEHGAAHPRHQLHVRDDVRTVRELDADMRNMAAERAHRERHHVHRAPAHAAVEQSM
jgi:hypothetical protein